MKKRAIDLTKAELDAYCAKHYCSNCPLHDRDGDVYICSYIRRLNKQVNVPDLDVQAEIEHKLEKFKYFIYGSNIFRVPSKELKKKTGLDITTIETLIWDSPCDFHFAKDENALSLGENVDIRGLKAYDSVLQAMVESSK